MAKKLLVVRTSKTNSSRDNYSVVAELGGEAYIPFQDRATGKTGGSPARRGEYWKSPYD